MSSRQVPPSTTSTPLVNSNDNRSSTDKPINEEDRTRLKEFGQLFNRESSINRALLEELFRKEPSEYTQTVYRYAARIYHCLKEDQINPVLKALSSTKEEPVQVKKATLDVPKIDYANDQQKRRTLKLAFSVLRYQKIVDELLDETQFFGHHSDLKDESSLVSTVLYDYLSRKFQVRDDPTDIDNKEEIANNDRLVTSIETAILQDRTRLAAALARNRIKSQALSLEDLLPENVREVQQHSAELPVYAWVNLIKTDMESVIKIFETEEQMQRVKTIIDLNKRAFCVDYHCSNLLVFHYTQKQRIANHPLVRDHQLYLQDKSSCVAAHTVRKLLTKKDNICLAYVSGGLLLQLLMVLTDELESKIYAFGARTDETIRDIQTKIKALGAGEKRVKIFKERFIDVNFEEFNIENCKVILCNPPDSRSALIQPLDFLYNEGEDPSLLKQFSQPVENKAYIKECIQRETAFMRQAVRYALGKAIVYVTFSKNKSENEEIVHTTINEQSEQRPQQTQRKESGSYKVSPPVLPIQFGIRNELMPVLRQGTFIQFESSQKMNGVFVALLLRDRERRRSTLPKKKTDDHGSDSDTQQNNKKPQQGFQFETEARAAQRRQQQQQQQQQTVKSHRKNAATSSSRRVKSSVGATRELAVTPSTSFQTAAPQPTQPVSTEPKVLTLSERLASIGRITSTLDTSQDEQTPTKNDLKDHQYQRGSRSDDFHWWTDDVQASISQHSLAFCVEECNQPTEDDHSIPHVIPTFASNNQDQPIIHREFLLNHFSLEQRKITFETSREILRRCRICQRSYRSVCRHDYSRHSIVRLLRNLRPTNRISSASKPSTD